MMRTATSGPTVVAALIASRYIEKIMICRAGGIRVLRMELDAGRYAWHTAPTAAIRTSNTA